MIPTPAKVAKVAKVHPSRKASLFSGKASSPAGLWHRPRESVLSFFFVGQMERDRGPMASHRRFGQSPGMARERPGMPPMRIEGGPRGEGPLRYIIALQTDYAQNFWDNSGKSWPRLHLCESNREYKYLLS
jgi:hypothetical protein